MEKRITVGIWGLGNAGRRMLIPELLEFSNHFQIVAGCDISEENLKLASECVPEMRLYSDERMFLGDPEIELIVVATRSIDHVPHALEALAAGKKVFLEKPIAVDEEGVCKLEEASKKYPGRLFFRHNRRFEPQFQYIWKICQSGVLGRIYEVKLHRHAFLFTDNWQSSIAQGGGYLNNWGPHVLDHALLFLESPVAHIWSNLRRVLGLGDAEDHARVILTGENGRVVEMEVSCGVALSQPEYVIFGDRGSLTCKGIEVILKHLASGHEARPPFEWTEEKISVPLEGVDHPKDIWKYLYATLDEGKEFPISTEHALEIVRICNAVKKGSRFQKKEEI